MQSPFTNGCGKSSGPFHIQNSNEDSTPQTTLSPQVPHRGRPQRPLATSLDCAAALRGRLPAPSHLPQFGKAEKCGRSRPRPPQGPVQSQSAAHRAAASPSVTSRNLATPQPSLRCRRRARSQHKMAAAGSAAGEERAERAPSSVPDKPGLQAPRLPTEGEPREALGEADSRRPRPEKENRRVAGRSVPVPPYKRPPPRTLPSALWPPQAPPRGSRAPAPTSINCAL